MDVITTMMDRITTMMDGITTMMDGMTMEIPTMITTLLSAIGIMYFTHKATTRTENKFDARFDKMDTKFNKLDDKFSRKFDALKDALSRLSNTVNRLIGHYQGTTGQALDVTDLGVALGNIELNNPTTSATVKATSPMTLTERGLITASSLDAEKLVERYIDRVRQSIPNDADKLQIQEICVNFAMATLLDIIDADEREIIEDAIFAGSGNRPNVLLIYAILFRDKILAERKIKIPRNKKSICTTHPPSS